MGNHRLQNMYRRMETFMSRAERDHVREHL